MMSTARIMVAEDDAVVARDLKETLTGLGYEVVSLVGSGDEAVNAAHKARPDLALLDIRMPGKLDGIEAGQRIMEQLRIPVVYVTAYGDDNTMQRAVEGGSFGYVLKPFDGRDLKAAVEVSLYRSWMEMRLRASEERFASTLRAIGEGVVATDARGRVSFMNEEAQRMTGWTEREAMGKKVGQVVRLRGGDPDGPALTPVEEALAERRTVQVDPDTILVGGHGRVHPISDTAAPVITDDGTMLGAVLVVRDESEARERERTLSRTQDQLQQVQKMDAVGRLAGGIAHDFNNILTTIQGYADLLLGRSDLPDDVLEDLGDIQDAADRAASLTRQLLTFSRKEVVAPELLSVNELIREVLRMLERLVGEDIDLVTELDPEVPPVRIDPSRFQQVVLNLVVNARDAMPGGGELQIRTLEMRSEEIEARGLWKGEVPERAVAIEVTDTGQGMSHAELEHVFEPFYTTKEEGTGLGLAIIWGIVGQARGTVTVSSERGLGTTFTVLLPVAEPDSD